MLGLVFLLSALLVFLYVILVWLLIMRALLGRCGGAKDLEAQRIFVWDIQYSPIKTSSYFDFSRPLSLRLRHPRMGAHHGDSPWRGWGWEKKDFLRYSLKISSFQLFSENICLVSINYSIRTILQAFVQNSRLYTPAAKLWDSCWPSISQWFFVRCYSNKCFVHKYMIF